ncbi:methylmalonyl-CoA mutase subunit beta [Psychroserpens sp. XS_ASV72]|uniref:methylmalonyl-CoA mutase subunit beta n=1 Tax=Psychroserpens sp. XS_ASV72 TaxID=3241293 RepID=UPI003513854D
MSKSLFDMFPDVSSKQWKQKIQVDLKGADYNDTLIWKSNEGIDVRPFYHLDEFENTPELSSAKVSNFKICQTIHATSAEEANSKALDAISKGAESIKFIIPNTSISSDTLIKDIDTSDTNIFVNTEFIDTDYIKAIDESVCVNTDIIGNLAKTGNWFSNLESDHKSFDEIVKTNNTIAINATLYQNAGANIVQQLAYALAHANEYLNHLDDVLDSKEKETLQVVFNVSVSTNYFFEIAKLKALRQLWNVLAQEYQVNPTCHIFATPSKRNKTIYDYNTNMLRTTTECMSAILGGADTINNLAYDALYHKPNDFGERISRNQALILKYESYFDKVDNPTDGSYYIETLTSQLSEKALQIFKDIEAQGGFLHQLKSGTIQRKIKESAHLEQQQFDNGALVLLGTNKHPNPEDQMKSELEIKPFVKANPIKTLIEPIIEKRLSEKLDINRLNNEK